MDINEIYHFLFETYAGIGCLVGAGLLISIIAAIITERKTRKTFRDRGEKNARSWEFDDETNETDEKEDDHR